MFSRRSKFALVVLTAVAVSGVLLPIETIDPAEKTLRVGTNPWPGYEFAYLAHEHGYFLDEGLNVRIVEFSSLGDARRAYERGQIDAFFGTVVEVVQAAAESRRRPKIAMIADYSDGADRILARREIATLADLQGKRVGVEPASIGGYIAARALETIDKTLSDVTVVFVEQVHMQAALERGDIDAVVTYPPMALEIARTGGVHEVFSTKMIPGEVVDVLAVDAEALKKHADLVPKFRKAFRRARRFTDESPKEAIAIMAGREGLTPEEFRDALNDGVHLVEEAEIDELMIPGGTVEEVIRKTIELLQKTGQIDAAFRIAPESLMVNRR